MAAPASRLYLGVLNQSADLDAPFFMAENVTRGNFVTRSGVYDLNKVKAGIGVSPLHTQGV